MTTAERSFEYGVLKVTVRRPKIRDRVWRDTLIARMTALELGDRGSRNIFASAVAQSAVEGMAWLNAAASDAEIAAAFEAWMDLDGDLYDRWQTELYLVGLPTNDPDLLPPEQIPAGGGEKKASPPSVSRGRRTLKRS
jgi:hypothetical protein